MSYSEILARLRQENRLTQSQVAAYIAGQTGKKCSGASVSSWEKGVALPPVHQFLLLCELYGVRDPQQTFRGAGGAEGGLSKLNALGRGRAEEYIAMLAENPLFAEDKRGDEEEIRPATRVIRLYDIPVAAGYGEFLDGDAYTELKVDETVPEDADFAVRVSGDSMTPRFVDNQVLFIRKQNVLEVGDIGIFSLNGDAYIKKFGNGELISINPRYLAIPIGEYDCLHIFGKVVG
ncbi:MAG: hypothetical protein FWE32_04110 [Oscillospiraceae bacterium]|nr:hypothetical protein [Oscillospiraceae bacterium]